VVFWRSDWTKNATAFAFKCGPSEGHHSVPLLQQFPDWRLSSGHAHPDANSFIIFAQGQYLTGDTGYAGVPLTEHHNTLLFGGKVKRKRAKVTMRLLRYHTSASIKSVFWICNWRRITL